MNRLVTIFGGTLFFVGAATFELLVQLGKETFRADLPPWMNVSIAAAGVGGFILILGLILPKRAISTIDAENAAKYFLRLALINGVAAGVFATPILVPVFEFPILITRWPGIYMVIAYTFFVIVAVLGALGWAGLYYMAPKLLRRDKVFRPLFFFQFSAMEVGVYLLSVFMFLGGYVGSTLVHQGVGDTVVGTAMEFAVIPSALGIFLLIASTLAGVVNIFLSRKIS